MRSGGIICLALGILLMVISAFPIIYAEGPEHVFLGLGCAALLAVPLILLGIFFTRRAADRAGRQGEAEASDAFLEKAAAVLALMQFGHVKKPNPRGGFFERLQAVDLNRLTLAGWLLTLTTLILLIGGALLMSLLQLGTIDPAARGAVGIIGGVLLAACFALVGYILLRLLGVPVLRPRNSSLDNDDPQRS
jgi:hypothetical protein